MSIVPLSTLSFVPSYNILINKGFRESNIANQKWQKDVFLSSQNSFSIPSSRYDIVCMDYEKIIHDKARRDNPMLVGYARVSTQDQNLDMQKRELKRVGCEKIYEDAMSGKQMDRPGLNLALEVIRQGDALVVWKLDRLGRSLKQLIALVEDLAQRGVHFKSLTDNIDTQTPAGRFFFHVMASLAEMERELIIERTRAGLDAARAQGRTGGRKRRMTDSKIESAKNLGVSIPTLYRWIPASEQHQNI